jgi:hypothetical protein
MIIFGLHFAHCQRRFVFVAAARAISFKYAANLVPNAPKDGELFFFRARHMRWIVESPVVAIHLSGKHGTRLVCVPAHCDYRLDRLANKLIKVFRAMGGYVDSDLMHCFNREGMHVASGLRSCARDADRIAGAGPQYSFGEMAPAGITSAKNENKGKFHIQSVI